MNYDPSSSITENSPFDLYSLAMGDSLFGRDDELAWLQRRFSSGANLLLFGAEGVGKSSLLQQAGAEFAALQRGFLIRLELSFHKTGVDAARVLDAAAESLSGGSPPANAGRVFGDVGRQTGADVRPDPRSVPAGELSQGTALLKSLQRLNTLATARSLSVVVAFDSFHHVGRLGGTSLESRLFESTRANTALGHVFAANSDVLTGQTPEALRNLHTLVESRRIGALEPHAFGQWIDRRFAERNIVARGVGASCIDIGGSNTAQVIELAQRTFEFSTVARFANEATVRSVLDAAARAKNAEFLSTWSALSEAEKKVLTAIARKGGPALTESTSKAGVKTDEPLRSAVEQLRDKRLVQQVGPGKFQVASPLFKQWTLTAGLNLLRRVDVGTSKQSTSVEFKMGVQSSLSRTLRSGPGL